MLGINKILRQYKLMININKYLIKVYHQKVLNLLPDFLQGIAFTSTMDAL